jgi:hypothetical protein
MNPIDDPSLQDASTASPAANPERREMRKRWRKLVHPGIQLRLTAWFAALALVTVSLQFVLVFSRLSDLAVDLPSDPAAAFDELTVAYVQIALLSLGIVLPLAVAVGVLATFRIAGPVVRISSFLESVVRGEKPADCRLRRGDELQELCQLVNDATAPRRRTDGALDRTAAPLPRGTADHTSESSSSPSAARTS